MNSYSTSKCYGGVLRSYSYRYVTYNNNKDTGSYIFDSKICTSFKVTCSEYHFSYSQSSYSYKSAYSSAYSPSLSNSGSSSKGSKKSEGSIGLGIVLIILSSIAGSAIFYFVQRKLFDPYTNGAK
jgi:hypothetical protein